MKNHVDSTDRDGFLLGPESRSAASTSTDFVLQWGNRKRQRCMKAQVKEHGIDDGPSGSGPVHCATTRFNGRVVRSDPNNSERSPISQVKNSGAGKSDGGGNGHQNFRQRPASPSLRTLRNCSSSTGMRGQSNGVRGLISPDRGDKKGGIGGNIHRNKNNDCTDNNDNHHQQGGGGGGSGSPETSCVAGITASWLPKFVIPLTNKEKEEDFMAIKGSKLPQRPKKRAKYIQRSLNLVSPGAWLCDLTLERYEVRENKVSKKRPRGLKAMCNMEPEPEPESD
ncbi:uncharacterized protein [Henckelia pumila]|uniref:uncharacterized protein n=1 Tax=Henckelia pumila TaxID=405737 RepID=UPI003C6DC9AE